MGLVLGYIVCADAHEAEKIAEALVREKKVACVSILPAVKSIFFWKGHLQKTNEALLLCKTVSELIPGVEKKVKSLHSYDVPCICFYPAEYADADYEKWLRQSVEDPA